MNNDDNQSPRINQISWGRMEVTGLGIGEVDFEWENSKFTRVIVLSTAGKNCKIMLPNGLKEFETEKGKRYDVLTVFDE